MTASNQASNVHHFNFAEPYGPPAGEQVPPELLVTMKVNCKNLSIVFGKVVTIEQLAKALEYHARNEVDVEVLFRDVLKALIRGFPSSTNRNQHI